MDQTSALLDKLTPEQLDRVAAGDLSVLPAGSYQPDTPAVSDDDVLKGATFRERSAISNGDEAAANALLQRDTKYRQMWAAKADPLTDFGYFDWAKRQGLMDTSMPKAAWQAVKGVFKIGRNVAEQAWEDSKKNNTDLNGMMILPGKGFTDAVVGSTTRGATNFVTLLGQLERAGEWATGATIGKLLTRDEEGRDALRTAEHLAQFNFLRDSADLRAAGDKVRAAVRDAVKGEEAPESYVEAGSMVADPTNIIMAGAGAGVTKSIAASIRVGMLRTAEEGIIRAGAEVTSARAVLKAASERAAAYAGEDALYAAAEVAAAESGLAAKEAALQTAKDAFSKVTEEVTAQLAPKGGVTGKIIAKIGSGTESFGKWLDNLKSVPAKIGERLAPDTAAGAEWVSGTIERGTGAAVGAAVGGAPGAVMGAVVGVPSAVVRGIGTDIKRIGETYAAGHGTLPFFRRLRKIEDVSGITAQLSAFIDSSVVQVPLRTAAGAAKGAAHAGAVGAGFGVIQGAAEGDPLAGAASGFGTGAGFGLVLGPIGEWQRYGGEADLQARMTATVSDFRRMLELNPERVDGKSQLEHFESLSPATQQSLAFYSQVHPDLGFRFESLGKGAASHYEPITQTMVINLDSSVPVKDLMTHEIGHHVALHGLEAKVETDLLGDPVTGRPGAFTKADAGVREWKNADGSVRRYLEWNDEFQKLIDQYQGLLDRGDTGHRATPSEIAQEVFAEHHADVLLDGKGFASLLRGGSPEWLKNTAFLKKALGSLGFPFEGDRPVVRGTQLFSELREVPGMRKMIEQYYRTLAKARKPADVEVDPVRYFDAEDLKRDTGAADKYFDATSEIKRDATGAPVYNKDGTPVFLKASEQRALSREQVAALVDALVKNPAKGPEEVQIRNTVDEKGRDLRQIHGRFFSEEVISAMEKSGKWNPTQIAYLRAVNTKLRAGGPVQFENFYQAASKKQIGGGSKEYRTLAGRSRVDSYYGLYLTKDGNLVFQTVSVERLQQNIQEAVRKGKAPLWNNSFSEVWRDANTYLENLTSGKPGDTGLGADKRDWLNNQLGIRVKMHGGANPWWEVTPQPKTILTSLRIDRSNRITPLEGGIDWGRKPYEQAAANLRPEVDSGVTTAEAPDEYAAIREWEARRKAAASAGGSGLADSARGPVGNPPAEGAIGAGELKLVHFSGNPGLTELDPKFMGRGHATAADQRGLEKSFFFVQGSEYGQDAGLINSGGKSVYGATVEQSRIYDYTKDALGIVKAKSPNRLAVEEAIRDAGYRGYGVETADGRQVVALFDKQPVQSIANDRVLFHPGERAQEHAANDGEMRRTKSGDSEGLYVGSPGITSPQQLSAFRRLMTQATKRGESGRFWYEESSKAIDQLVSGDRRLADKLAQMIGIFSPQTPVATNWDFAVRAFLRWKEGVPEADWAKMDGIGKYPAAMGEKARDLLYRDKDWEGRKTNNFYNNLMVEIDPSRVQGTTVDMWIMRAFGYDTDATTDGPRYDFAQREMKRVAETLGDGWKPHQVQAAIWVYAKTLWEGMRGQVEKAAARAGIAEDAMNLDNEAFATLYREQFAKKMKADLALEEGGVQPAANSVFNFGTALRSKPLFLSWEATPGKSSGVLPELLKADYQTKLEFTGDVLDALHDPKTGRDVIGEELGWSPTEKPSKPESGAYYNSAGELEFNPASQIPFFTPPAKGGESGLKVDPLARKAAEDYATILGHYTHQEAVGGYRPFWADSARKGQRNAIAAELGRPMTSEEVGRAVSLIAPNLKSPDSFAFFPHPEGGRFLNLDPELPNPKFHDIVEAALEEIIPDDQPINTATFFAEGLYAPSSGAARLRAERPDLFGKLDARLKPQLEAVYSRWADRLRGAEAEVKP